jgi:hypothetical protein
MVVDKNTQMAGVEVDVSLHWDMDALNFLFNTSNSSSSSISAAAGDKMTSTSATDDSSSDHASFYMSQLQSSWLLSISLYEEGILVSSSQTATSHCSVFDGAGIEPINTVKVLAPIPGLSSGSSGSSSGLSSGSGSSSSKESESILSILGWGSSPSTTMNTGTVSLPKGGSNGIAKSTQNIVTIPTPVYWSAERPHVYTLVISLQNAQDGTIAQAESCRVGFRKIDVSNGQLRVNYRPIMIRGVNYHEHDPVTGHTVSPS